MTSISSLKLIHFASLQLTELNPAPLPDTTGYQVGNNLDNNGYQVDNKSVNNVDTTPQESGTTGW